MDVPMPDADRKRARDEAGSAEAGAGLPIDTQAGFTMLRMMLPALRPQQKNSRCAEDTLALIIEQWVIDANAALRESGGGGAFASYTPTLRTHKALDPKQRQKKGPQAHASRRRAEPGHVRGLGSPAGGEAARDRVRARAGH